MSIQSTEQTKEKLSEQIAAEQAQFLEAIETELATFFEKQAKILSSISADSLPLLESIRQLSTGGKRMRALLCYWGWRGAGGASVSDSQASEAVVKAGAALELFQSAALIHDDIIDRSDTRRGAPAVYKQFEATHRANRWATDSAVFGISSGIIAGDLCLSWSEMVFGSIGADAGSEARFIFDLMRTEVMAGQYLDVLGEVAGADDYVSALLRAQNVIRFKAAKYSCEHPLALGGALALGLHAGQRNGLLDSYRAFALPLGEGFQLRDDVLGVFGQTEVTGKPAGDDLKEGKRTVLVALTEKHAAADDWKLLDDSLGRQDLSAEEVRRLQELIERSGALEEIEQMIADTENRVAGELEAIEVNETVAQALHMIAAKALHRAA